MPRAGSPIEALAEDPVHVGARDFMKRASGLEHVGAAARAHGPAGRGTMGPDDAQHREPPGGTVTGAAAEDGPEHRLGICGLVVAAPDGAPVDGSARGW